MSKETEDLLPCLFCHQNGIARRMYRPENPMGGMVGCANLHCGCPTIPVNEDQLPADAWNEWMQARFNSHLRSYGIERSAS